MVSGYRLAVLGLMLAIVAVLTGADSVSSGYRQAKEDAAFQDEIGQMERSALWERLLPVNHLSFYADEFEEVIGPIRRDDRDITVSFRPLCETVVSRKEFNRTVTGHEFRPPFYQEVLCKSNEFREGQIPQSLANSQMCIYPGYSCIQRKREMSITRRRFGANCWEPVTVTVPSNCECMWPQGHKGEVE